MEHLIIDVVIGLLLIYLAASFLLMKVQENLHGGILKGRVTNMHRMLDEAVGHDPDVKKRLLDNRLISSLWSGSEESSAGRRFTPGVGPSKIPGDLFAKALLMTLNPSGNLPSSEGRTPIEFMDGLLKNLPQGSEKYQYLQALRGLVPGSISGWPEFEMAIATWFCDISDRAEGWYKRQTEWVGFWIALALCILCNIDTRHIVNVLGSDTELRQGFGAVAELVVEQQYGRSTTAATPMIDPAMDPAVRAMARLRDAQRNVVEVFRKDPSIASYGAYESDVTKVCGVGYALSPKALTTNDEGKYLSNSDTWVLVLTRLQPSLQGAINRLDNNSDTTLRNVYQCLTHVGAWVNSAVVVSKNPETRGLMLEAAKAIEDSASSVLSVIRGTEAFAGLRRLFLVDPEAFERCSKMKLQGATALSACVLKEQDLMNRLPVGHGEANWRQQFCRVKSTDASPIEPREKVPAPAPAPASAPSPAYVDPPEKNSGIAKALCGDKLLPAQPHLGLPPLHLEFDWYGLLASAGGILVSALFISLGAPVLFGLLNKWVNLKNAGHVRDATRSGIQGAGTLPLPMLAIPAVVAASTGADQVTVTSLTTVEGALAGFEEWLSPREIQAVKQRLGVQPSTGGFEAQTRAAIKAATGDEQLTLASYTQLMGRPPVRAGQSIGALPSAQPRLLQPFALAPTLAENLNEKLSFPGRVPTTTTTFSHELRALAVLYRFKKDSNQTHSAPVFDAVMNSPQQLDQIDAALLNSMLGASVRPEPRFPSAPWMDIALGELGQVERNGSSRATSNPRVCEYLDAVRTSLGDLGDTTPWCAAFVTWVLKHPQAVVPAIAPPSPIPTGWVDTGNGLLMPANTPESALSWARWPRPPNLIPPPPVAGTGGNPPPLVGDVVVVNVGNGKHHTGFVFEVSAATNELWLLGGNQRGGTRVSLSRFTLSSIV